MDTRVVWFVYMPLCDQKTFYIGITDRLKSRLTAHKNKESFYTKKFSEIRMVYVEKYSIKREAVAREQQSKGWNRATKQMLMDGQLGINRLASAELAEALS